MAWPINHVLLYHAIVFDRAASGGALAAGLAKPGSAGHRAAMPERASPIIPRRAGVVRDAARCGRSA